MGFINPIVQFIQSVEEWTHPVGAGIRRDIEKNTGIPLTAKDPIKPESPKVTQQRAAGGDSQAEALYRNDGAVGGQGNSGAQAMVTVKPDAVPATLGKKTYLGS